MALLSPRRLGLSLALAVFASVVPAAQAAELPIQALLRTAGGGPVADGNYIVFLHLYDGPTAPGPLWQVVLKQVPVQGGLLHVVAGVDGGEALPDALVATGKTLWLGVAVGGDPELPRVPLRPAPSALYASAAGDLACSGCVGSTDLAAGAVLAAHVGFAYAASQTKGGPADKALTADHATTADSAKKATAATTAEEALIATQALKLACTGCVTADMLAADALAGVVAKAGGTMTGKLVAQGGVDLQGGLLEGARLGAVDVQKTGCGATDLGRIALGSADGKPWFCDGKAWRRLASCGGLCPAAATVTCGEAVLNDCGDACNQTGTACPAGKTCSGGQCEAAPGSKDKPALHCKAVLAAQPGAATGVYWLDPDGAGGASPFEGWCEMQLEGGGWTLVAAQQNAISGDAATPGLADVGSAKAGAETTVAYNSTFLGRPYTEVLAVQPETSAWIRFSGLDIAAFETELKDTAGEISQNANCQTDVWQAGAQVRGGPGDGSVKTFSPPAPVVVEVHHSSWNAASTANFILVVGPHPPGGGTSGSWGFFGGATAIRVDGVEKSGGRSQIYVR